MGKTNAERGTRNAERSGKRYRFAAAAPLALLFCLGCAGSNIRQPPAAADPLAGGVATPAGGPSASAVPPPTPVPPPVPPLPVSTGTQSLAALAAGAQAKPLDATRDLRIATPVNNPNAGTSPQATLIAPATPVVSQPVARGSAPAGTHVATFEQAQGFLTSRGVKWQSLQTWGDQGAWKFTCSIPNPKNQYISRTYEGQARDSLSAIQAVIDQIERDTSSGF